MQKKVTIVGSGIIGCSIALHLQRAGCSVTVVDQGEPGGLATRHSFAWINASWGNPEFYFRVRQRAMAEWRSLAASVPDLGLHICGGLLWDLPPAELEAYAAEQERWGYGIERVGREAAQSIEPGLRSPPEFALHVCEEGMVEPVHAAKSMLASAGITVTRTRASALLEKGGRVCGVATDAGLIDADEVVVAAGAKTAGLLAGLGMTIAMTAPAGLIAHSTPIGKNLLNGLVLAPELRVRQTSEGRLIAGSDFAGADPENNERMMAADLIAKVKAMLQGTDAIALDFFTIGHRPTPADGFPCIGRLKNMGGLYVAVMHSGITLAPLVGVLAAREIDRDDRDPMLDAFHPDRPALAIAA